jgi:hypothetical protein
MIVKIQKAGSSFAGLASYLTEQKERVAWTHSLNCANDDHVPSIVHEMYTTYSQAGLLKEHADVHAGGREVDAPVKHISLNWHPDEKPSQAEMIATAESFLKEMGWQEHQALLVAHNDKPHSHVHIELNRIHPETGKVFDDSFERRRASDWALNYEREHGKLYCEQRQLEPHQRTPSPSRETWEQLRNSERKVERDEADELQRSEGYLGSMDRAEVLQKHEWEILKQRQREERKQFFEDSKPLFREARKQATHHVREDCRHEWGNLYEDKRNGEISQEEFEFRRAYLADWQREKLKERLEDVYGEIKQERAEEYRELLAEQKLERHELHRAQDTGRTSYELLDLVAKEPEIAPYLVPAEAANQNEDGADTPDEQGLGEEAPELALDGANDNGARLKSGFDGLASIGDGLISGLASIAERLLDSFLGGPPPRQSRPPPEPDLDARTRREALRAQKIEEAIEAAQQDRDRQRDDAYWQDRQRNRG